MRIHDDHLYHGAALIRIAEHPQFTAINSFNIQGYALRNVYKVNDHIGVYLKYCARPTKSYKEYTFTFNQHHLDELIKVKSQVRKLFMVMVCVKNREICCIDYDELIGMIDNRLTKKGSEEEQYTVKVTVPKGKSMRVYMDFPGKRKTMLGKAIVVSRNRFPDLLFE